jgi:hypothetical protein
VSYRDSEIDNTQSPWRKLWGYDFQGDLSLDQLKRKGNSNSIPDRAVYLSISILHSRDDEKTERAVKETHRRSRLIQSPYMLPSSTATVYRGQEAAKRNFDKSSVYPSSSQIPRNETVRLAPLRDHDDKSPESKSNIMHRAAIAFACVHLDLRLLRRSGRVPRSPRRPV